MEQTNLQPQPPREHVGRKAWVPDLTQVEALAARGLNEKQIREVLSIGADTFYKNKRLNAEFSEALARGKAKGISRVANVVFENAAEKGDQRAAEFYLKTVAKWRDNDPPAEINIIIPPLFAGKEADLIGRIVEEDVEHFPKEAGYGKGKTEGITQRGNGTKRAPATITAGADSSAAKASAGGSKQKARRVAGGGDRPGPAPGASGKGDKALRSGRDVPGLGLREEG